MCLWCFCVFSSVLFIEHLLGTGDMDTDTPLALRELTVIQWGRRTINGHWKSRMMEFYYRGEHSGVGRAAGTSLRLGGGEVGGVWSMLPEMRKETKNVQSRGKAREKAQG